MLTMNLPPPVTGVRSWRPVPDRGIVSGCEETTVEFAGVGGPHPRPLAHAGPWCIQISGFGPPGGTPLPRPLPLKGGGEKKKLRWRTAACFSSPRQFPLAPLAGERGLGGKGGTLRRGCVYTVAQCWGRGEHQILRAELLPLPPDGEARVRRAGGKGWGEGGDLGVADWSVFSREPLSRTRRSGAACRRSTGRWAPEPGGRCTRPG
jgi:hypothetical protein